MTKNLTIKLLLAVFALALTNQVQAQLITNIAATSGHSYLLSKLTTNTIFFTDRDYKTTTVPGYLNNAPFIKTPNEDKTNKTTSLLTFNLTQSATLYVAYDSRASKVPSWLSGWKKLTDKIGINDPKVSNVILYSKSFSAGKITLGGNLASPAAGALNTYFVIGLASTNTPPGGPYSLTIGISGNGTVTKNPNQTSYNNGTSVTLTANPASGQQFTGWSDDATGTTSPLTITMNANKSVTATFAPVSSGGGNGGGGSAEVPDALFVENMDKFPSNDNFVFSHIQIPWSRDKQSYNANHDSSRVRIHNNGVDPLTISKLTISNTAYWSIVKLDGVNYNSAQLPVTIASGKFLDLMVKFVAKNLGNSITRVRVLHETLTIASNDNKVPNKKVFLHGIWQYSGEGSHEPFAQEIFSAFKFKSNAGYGARDPDKGDSTKLKGDEVKPNYFVRADASVPVTITQLASYRGCCYSSESIKWFPMGSSVNATTTIFSSIVPDGQTLLPRKNNDKSPAVGTFSPTVPFGIVMGFGNSTVPAKNPNKILGVRVYKAFDSAGNIIPNAYLLTSDYIGTEVTNYDYQDNVYYATNLKPLVGTVYYSPLKAIPSAIEFGEKVLQTVTSFQLNISNEGKTYSNGSKDPALVISSLVIQGENKSEFSANMPSKTTLNPQEKTTINVTFKPASQGLKIADLLIYYKNSPAPKRVPLYGISKGPGVTVTANYRINSGGSAVTVNGKNWAADNKYAHDNLEPYKNSALKEIAGTDEDVLFLDEQSSDGDKKPFRYELPVSNGTYYVRLHFAELFWSAPGTGYSGGAGSRVFSVKIENQYKLKNFDPTSQVGGATAIVKNIPVVVSDGKLNIDFSAVVNRPMVCALEVYSFSGSGAARETDTLTDTLLTIQGNRTALPPQVEQLIEKTRLYPNPLHDNFTLKFPSNYRGSYHIQLVDLLGKRYDLGKNSVNEGSAININISKFALKPGMYLLRLSLQNKVEVLKLMIE